MRKEATSTAALSMEAQWWLGMRSIILTLLCSFVALMVIGQLLASLGLPLAPVTRGSASPQPPFSFGRVLLLVTAGVLAGVVGTAISFRLALQGRVQQVRPWLTTSTIGWSLIWLVVVVNVVT